MRHKLVPRGRFVVNNVWDLLNRVELLSTTHPFEDIALRLISITFLS